jgi:hypothetical protein
MKDLHRSFKINYASTLFSQAILDFYILVVHIILILLKIAALKQNIPLLKKFPFAKSWRLLTFGFLFKRNHIISLLFDITISISGFVGAIPKSHNINMKPYLLLEQ